MVSGIIMKCLRQAGELIAVVDVPIYDETPMALRTPRKGTRPPSTGGGERALVPLKGAPRVPVISKPVTAKLFQVQK